MTSTRPDCLSTLLGFSLLLFFGAASPVAARPGDFDPTFATNGIDIRHPGNGIDQATAVAIQSDGSIVVAGTTEQTNTQNDIVLFRYLGDGTLDGSFGNGGRVISDLGALPGGFDYANCLLVLADGNILVAGASGRVGTGMDFALARFAPNGTLDGGFGSGGKTFTALSTGLDTIHAMVVQDDGKIVVAGETDNESSGSNFAFGLARYTAAGLLDTSFGSGGKIISDLSTENDAAYGVAVQADGKIVAAGYSNNGDNDDVALVRYHANGTLDATFGSGGKVLTNFRSDGSGSEYANAVAIQRDGKIVIAGSNIYGMLVFRYRSDGTLDPSFGKGGKVLIDFDHRFAGANALALRPDGSMVVVGARYNDLDHDVATVSLKANGALDSGFGQGGKSIHSLGDGNDRAFGVAIQADGKVLVAGETETGAGTNDYAMAVMRFLDRAILPPIDAPVFDTKTVRADGATFLSFGPPAVEDATVAGAASVRLSNGRKQTIIYADANADVVAQTGNPDPEGCQFVAVGDPLLGPGELAFAGTALQKIPQIPPVGSERVFSVRPGGKLSALYSRVGAASPLRRLAVQTGTAPGVDGGQFAKFGPFGLPRGRTGLIFAATLHRGGDITAANDFGVWREKTTGGECELFLRTGDSAGSHTIKKFAIMTSVPLWTDQRRSFSYEGGLVTAATFTEGGSGIVRVADDGTVDVPVEIGSDVPDKIGGSDNTVKFASFGPPAMGSPGNFAFLAALKPAASRLAVPRQAVFSNFSGTLNRLLARGDSVPGEDGVYYGKLGDPSFSASGAIALVTALTGRPAASQAIVRIDNSGQTIVARVGEQVAGLDDRVVYRRFNSIAINDNAAAHLVFVATIGGPGINAGNNLGLWSYSPSSGVKLLARKGGPILVEGDVLTLRTLEALQASKTNIGRGRSADADGFVVAKAKLSDGRTGVLRIPLP